MSLTNWITYGKCTVGELELHIEYTQVSQFFNVVISPWTGTAIGKNNMPAFKCFVPLVIVCLTVDIILLVAPI